MDQNWGYQDQSSSWGQQDSYGQSYGYGGGYGYGAGYGYNPYDQFQNFHGALANFQFVDYGNIYGDRNNEAREIKFENLIETGTTEEAEKYRAERNIKIVSCKEVCPAPVMSFEELEKYNVPEFIRKGFLVNQMNFSEPSPIQSQTWPIALSGRDMIGIAETGSGKTLAFLVPAAVHVMDHRTPQLRRGETGPIILVLAPTRELAQQIDAESQKLSQATEGKVRSCCLVGGVPKGGQARELRNGREVVIATPGRLLDLLDQNHVGFNLDKVAYLCLDEADRMLDMGFEKDIRRIASIVASNGNKIQTMLFSATWPKEVQRLARDVCSQEPVHVHIGDGQVGELKANPRIHQRVEVVDEYSIRNNPYNCSENDVDCYKLDRLAMIIEEERDRVLKERADDIASTVASSETDAGEYQTPRRDDNNTSFKTIVFCATKKGCDWVARRLSHMGALAIHGDKSQQDRDWTLQEFKRDAKDQYENRGYYSKKRSPPCDVLVATDVAARGLDIKNVELIVNYDFPLNVEDYVHRIGRTGRAGKYGVAHSFFVKDDLKGYSKAAWELICVMRKAGQSVPPELEMLADRNGRGFNRYGGGGGKGGYGKGGGKRGGNDRGGYGGNSGGYGRSNGGGYNSYGGGNTRADTGSWR